MSRVLAGLLQKPEQQVTAAIAKLESLSGYTSEDVRLLAEVRQKLRLKTAQLGLDPDDTTAAELYQAAQAKLADDLRHINGTLKDDDLLTQLVDIFNDAPLERRVWALKQTVVRKMLRANPPKRLMRALSYRSVESLLKREHPALLVGGALRVESQVWQNKFWRQLSQVAAADFEDRQLRMVPTAAKRWAEVVPRGTFITLVPQLGAAVVWPPSESVAKAGAGLVVIMLQAAESLRDYGSRLKLCQFDPHLGKTAAGLWRRGDLQDLATGPLKLSWQSIRHHVSRQPEGLGQLGPHMRTEDLHCHSAAAAAAQLWPRLAWWAGAEHLAAHSSHSVVSLNLSDAIHNYVAGARFGRQTAANFQQSLWDKLAGRYLAHPAAEAYAYARLAPDDELEFNAHANMEAHNNLKQLTEELQAV